MKIVLLIGLVVLTILTIDNYLFWYWYICVTKDTYGVPMSKRFKVTVITLSVILIISWIFVFC